MNFLGVRTDYAFKKVFGSENIKEQWIYFVKNAGSLEYIPNSLDERVRQALENANEANLTKDELEAQYKRKEFISIQKLALMKADKDGFVKGVARGREEGERQKALEIAKNLALKTGLQSIEIAKLRRR